MKALLALFALALALVPLAAAAGRDSTLSWGPLVRHIQNGMDTPEPPDGHNPWNSTGCAWNDEDELGDSGGGSLSGTATDTVCLVSDLMGGSTPYPKAVIFRVAAPKSTLAVSLSNDAGDSWQSPPPFAYQNQYWWQLCVKDPVAIRGGVSNWQDLAYWPLVPGTTGYGQIVHYTLSITSTRNTTQKVSAYLEAAYSEWLGGPKPVIQILAQMPGEVPCPS